MIKEQAGMLRQVVDRLAVALQMDRAVGSDPARALKKESRNYRKLNKEMSCHGLKWHTGIY